MTRGVRRARDEGELRARANLFRRLVVIAFVVFLAAGVLGEAAIYTPALRGPALRLVPEMLLSAAFLLALFVVVRLAWRATRRWWAVLPPVAALLCFWVAFSKLPLSKYTGDSILDLATGGVAFPLALPALSLVAGFTLVLVSVQVGLAAAMNRSDRG